jgi:hypothetical protein
MIIPPNPDDREFFYKDLIRKCQVSSDERRTDYSNLRSYYLFGNSEEESPAVFNKIHPHIDQLTSFLYSSETTRFSINLGASVDDREQFKVPKLTQALNDEWLNSNADQVFSTALTWALVYNTTFIKLIYNKGIQPFMIEPSSIGVLREDVPYTSRQEALVHTYYITKSELYARLYDHPKREQIVNRVNASYAQQIHNEVPDGLSVILSQSQVNMVGNVNMNLGQYNKYKAKVAEDTIEMKELWLWNDETCDYQVVTCANPDVIIYDRPGEKVFLKGELPFVQICPNPQYDYYWGQSEVQRMILLQEARNKRFSEITQLLAKQVNPPMMISGFSGIMDEKNFALNRAGSFLSSDMPNAKVDKLAPQMPADLFSELDRIDAMFEEVSGITNVLAGKGESGVRSTGHASQLARLGSSRAKKRALIVEDSLEKVATLYLKLMAVYDNTHFKTENDKQNMPFIAEQFTRDYAVKVDAHSNSPIFMEDMRNLAFSLFKAQAIDKESLLDLLEPPMKQLLKERLKTLEEKQQSAKESKQPAPKEKSKPELKVM